MLPFFLFRALHLSPSGMHNSSSRDLRTAHIMRRDRRRTSHGGSVSESGVCLRIGYGEGKMGYSQNNISSTIEVSRKELLDLGLRNPLLNYRPSRARGVQVVDELPAEVFRILVRERKAMSFKAAPEETGNGSEEALWLAQPGDEDAQEGPAARHVDTQLQTNLGSAKLQSRLIKT